MDLQHLRRIGLVPASCSGSAEVAKPDLKAENRPSEPEHDALLQMASAYVEIQPRSLFPSCLSGWQAWSQSHPQHAASVQVQEGRSPLPTSARSLSVVSWNVLAQHMLQKNAEDQESHDYAHLTPEYVADVRHRQSEVLRWLAQLSPDLILLQEVDMCRYTDSFEAPLQALGYDGSSQARDNNMCCATFWRRDKLSCQWNSSGETVPKKQRQLQSRTLLQCFQLIGLDTHSLLVLNAHLDAARSQWGQESRAKALDFALGRLSKQFPGAPLLAAGDFNVNPDNAIMAALRKSRWHGFELASAYEHPAAGSTSTVLEATCAIHPYRDLFDQIWYRHGRLRLCHILQALSPDERYEAFRMDGPGLPNQVVPSDHAPVGAVFEFL